MNFVCVVFELCDKMLTLSSMENLIVPCNRKPAPSRVIRNFSRKLVASRIDVVLQRYD